MPGASRTRVKKQYTPGPSSHLHTGIKGRLTVKVIHDDAMVTIDDMLIDALPTEVLKDLIDAVDTVQNGLEDNKRKKRNNEKVK